MARCFGLATNLAKENEPKENPKGFPSKHKENNVLYTLCLLHKFVDKDNVPN